MENEGVLPMLAATPDPFQMDHCTNFFCIPVCRCLLLKTQKNPEKYNEKKNKLSPPQKNPLLTHLAYFVQTF